MERYQQTNSLKRRIKSLEHQLTALKILQTRGFWHGFGRWLALWLAVSLLCFGCLAFSGAVHAIPTLGGGLLALLCGAVLTFVWAAPRTALLLLSLLMISIVINAIMAALFGESSGLDCGSSSQLDAPLSLDGSSEPRNRRRIAKAIAKRENQLKELKRKLDMSDSRSPTTDGTKGTQSP